MSRIKTGFSFLKKAAIHWNDDNATIHGAALSYYTAFSIAPLLMIAIAVAGLFLGQQASQGDIFTSLNHFFGADTAQGIQTMVQNAAAKPKAGWFSGVVGIITLLVGASGVFQQLQQSLNLIWGVQADPSRGIRGTIRQRVLSFSMVGVIAFLLLVSLLASTAVAALGKYLAHDLPGGEALWHVINNLVSFAVITLLFAMVFKVLPDVRLSWRSVMGGSAVTAALFVVGKFLIGLYLAKSSVASSYGAAGSLVLLLLWVYYSSLIVFYGAELTKVFVTRHGKSIVPKKGAQLVTAASATPAGALRTESKADLPSQKGPEKKAA